MTPSIIDQLMGFAEELTPVFERCRIPYYVSHPLASLLLGESFSQDNLVIVAKITPDQVLDLVQSIPDHLYIDPSHTIQIGMSLALLEAEI